MKTKLTNRLRMSQDDWNAFYVLVGGIIGLIVAMGIGRFSYTPILPLMQRDLGMSNIIAGWLASLNYLGYLAGAIIYSFMPQQQRKRCIIVICSVMVVLTTVGMGCVISHFWWGVMRFISGLSSAVLFIIISAEVSDVLARCGRVHWNGVLYSGVGLGIVLSGLVVPMLDRVGHWNDLWISLGIIAFLLLIIQTAMTIDVKGTPQNTDVLTNLSRGITGLGSLVVAYFFEGLGYIVTATFLVAIVANTPGLEPFSNYSWVAVGFAAIPSTLIWPLLARRIGRKDALSLAYILQAVGVLISVHADSIVEVILAASIFGGTFMGITALIMMEAQARLHHSKRKAAAILTASFGAGQILGPIIAGYLADIHGDFTLPLLLAAISVVIGCVFIESDGNYADQKQYKEVPTCHT